MTIELRRLSGTLSRERLWSWNVESPRDGRAVGAGAVIEVKEIRERAL